MDDLIKPNTAAEEKYAAEWWGRIVSYKGGSVGAQNWYIRANRLEDALREANAEIERLRSTKPLLPPSKGQKPTPMDTFKPAKKGRS